MTRNLRRSLLLILVLLIVFFIVQRTPVFPSLKTFFEPKPVLVDETPLLLTQIKSIAQLMTVEAYNEVVIDSTRYPFGVPPQVFKAIPGNPLTLISPAQLVLIVRGKVIAGVDLQSLDKNSIQVKGDSLFVQLPGAQVLEIITNPSDVETFIEKGTWDETAATALKVKARNKMVQQAIAQGALQQADAKARQLVYGFLKNSGYKYITVTTAIRANTPSAKQ